MISDLNYGLLICLAILTWISLCVLNAHNLIILQSTAPNLCLQSTHIEDEVLNSPVPEFPLKPEVPVPGKIYLKKKIKIRTVFIYKNPYCHLDAALPSSNNTKYDVIDWVFLITSGNICSILLYKFL